MGKAEKSTPKQQISDVLIGFVPARWPGDMSDDVPLEKRVTARGDAGGRKEWPATCDNGVFRKSNTKPDENGAASQRQVA